ncbi:MAG TPA: ATP synthase F1 subunit epsilon [Clostridiales bacterium]|nr:ATP synthase F1 subunit epsilon [Clostridiales bacterium]
MNTFSLNILAADRPFYKGPCESLIVPSLDGQHGILANHCNMIIAVEPGTLIYRPPGEENQIVAVSHGVVKVENNDVLVLVDSVERLDEIDANRARRAAEAAMEAMLHTKSIREYRIAQAHLARALNRLKVKGNYDLFQGFGK